MSNEALEWKLRPKSKALFCINFIYFRMGLARLKSSNNNAFRLTNTSLQSVSRGEWLRDFENAFNPLLSFKIVFVFLYFPVDIQFNYSYRALDTLLCLCIVCDIVSAWSFSRHVISINWKESHENNDRLIGLDQRISPVV